MSSFGERGKAELRGLAKDVLQPRLRGGGIQRGFHAGIGNPVRQAARHLRDLVAATFSRPGGPLTAEDIARRELVLSYKDAEMRFRVAGYLHGADADVVRRKQVITFWKTVVFAGGAVAMASWIAYRWQHVTGIEHLYLCCYSAFVLLFSVNAWSCAFHNWQLRRGRLDGIGTWMSRPTEWLPRLPESLADQSTSPASAPARRTAQRRA